MSGEKPSLSPEEMGIKPEEMGIPEKEKQPESQGEKGKNQLETLKESFSEKFNRNISENLLVAGGVVGNFLAYTGMFTKTPELMILGVGTVLVSAIPLLRDVISRRKGKK